jgi:speckle-type POZ protein
VSIFLELMSEAKGVTAIFDITVMCGGEFAVPSSLFRSRCRHAYSHPPGDDEYQIWGFYEILSRESIHEYYSKNNGRVKIMWAVSVVDDIKSVSIADMPAVPFTSKGIAVPPSDMGDNLRGMLHSAVCTDVSFIVDNGRGPAPPIHAHRAFLAARSPVFKAQLCGHMLETNTPALPIIVRDMEPETFKAMIGFMYTDDLPADLGDDEDLRCLLAAADLYALNRLKLLCAQKMLNNVSADTVASTLDCAETYSCPELKRKCIDFVVADENFKKVVLTDGFMELVARSPSILAEIRSKCK